ncbi:MAG TPA: hypothetical protein VGO86_14945, partial [Candidatus Dormibacteraeota bacterium]
MRRAALAAIVAGTIAIVAVLDAAPPAPASADLLPTPLPSLLPVRVPLPTAPVSQTVNQVVGGVTHAVPAPGNSLPLHPSQSGQPASAASSGGAGAGVGSAGPGGEQPAAAAPQPQPQASHEPSPEERSALPDEPRRAALEDQQAWLGDAAAGLDQQDGATAVSEGGGEGLFGWPIAFAGHPPITQRFGCTD